MTSAQLLAKTVCEECGDDRAMLLDVMALCANAYFLPLEDVDRDDLCYDAFVLREWIKGLVQPEARH